MCSVNLCAAVEMLRIPIYTRSVQQKILNVGPKITMKSNTTPTEIQRKGTNGLRITWADGAIEELSSESLRRQCPCAECREKRGDDTHAKPLTGKKRTLSIVQNSMEEELALSEIWGVGQYAIGIRWGDGHDSGIYTFDYLRDLQKL